MATHTKEQELIEIEQRFWDAMQSKDGGAAAQLTDDGSIIVGAQGVSKIDRKSMSKMTDEGKWELKEFSFNEKTRQVRFQDFRAAKGDQRPVRHRRKEQEGEQAPDLALQHEGRHEDDLHRVQQVEQERQVDKGLPDHEVEREVRDREGLEPAFEAF